MLENRKDHENNKKKVYKKTCSFRSLLSLELIYKDGISSQLYSEVPVICIMTHCGEYWAVIITVKAQ